MPRTAGCPRSVLHLEPLERRDAPATLVSPSRLTYQDADGDNVAVVFSKPILNAVNVNAVFTFDTGTVNGSNATKQQLRSINLTAVLATAAGTSVTVTAARSPANGGDGFAAVGQISADSIDLGPVAVDGDLGRIRAGGATPTARGVKGLTVQSMGRYGTSTGAPDLLTAIQGRLDFLRVNADVKEASIDVQGRGVGPVFVGGSLIGGAADQSGSIRAAAMGFVTVRGNLTGGGGSFSGAVMSLGKLAGANIGGSVQGGAGSSSGAIASDGDMGFVTVRGNLVGGPAGPPPFASGIVSTNAKLAGVTIGGSVIGGTGSGGQIHARGAMGLVTIVGNLSGGSGERSGEVTSNTSVAGVRIGGSVQGGTGNRSGAIIVDKVGTIVIGGDLAGGSASGTTGLNRSGFISAGRVGSITLGGSLIAGTDNTVGVFQANGAIEVDSVGTVLIKGSIIGNPTNPASISAIGQPAPTGTTDVAIGSVRVGGRVEFGEILAGYGSGNIALNADAQIGTVVVGGDWVASSIAAGALPGANGHFGDADDVKMSGLGIKDDPGVFSRIGRLAVGGQVMGTVGGTDHFGIVAEVVGAVSVGGTSLPLTSGKSNDDLSVGITGDVRVNEI